MDDLETRLIDCYQAVLPSLSVDEIRAARLDTTPGWDSLKTITLLAVLEEEFGVTVGPDEIPEMTSFGAILALLRGRAAPK
jgi:acyl carrier protein